MYCLVEKENGNDYCQPVLEHVFFDDIPIEVYDLETNKTVFKGNVTDVSERFGEYEVDSLDVYDNHTLCINLTI